MQLTRHLAGELTDALVAAFSSNEFEEVFARAFPQRLEEVAKSAELRHMVFEVVGWCTRNESVPTLVEVARRRNPNHEHLRSVALRLGVEPLTPPGVTEVLLDFANCRERLRRLGPSAGWDSEEVEGDLVALGHPLDTAAAHVRDLAATELPQAADQLAVALHLRDELAAVGPALDRLRSAVGELLDADAGTADAGADLDRSAATLLRRFATIERLLQELNGQ